MFMNRFSKCLNVPKMTFGRIQLTSEHTFALKLLNTHTHPV